jgi:hypothetical protein
VPTEVPRLGRCRADLDGPATEEVETVTTTGTTPRVRDVPAGTLVIYASGEGVYEYEGPTDGSYDQIALGFGARREHNGLKCRPEHVAPADTPIPDKDDRVVAVKRDRGQYPTHKGPWLLIVADKPRDHFRTKRDATKAGLRTVAIIDWHATQQPTHEYREAPSDKYEHLVNAQCVCGWKAAGYARPTVARSFFDGHITEPGT